MKSLLDDFKEGIKKTIVLQLWTGIGCFHGEKIKLLKVLCVSERLYPSVVGGIGLHVHEISKWQVKYGSNVTIYTSKVGGEPTQEFREGYSRDQGKIKKCDR